MKLRKPPSRKSGEDRDGHNHTYTDSWSDSMSSRKGYIRPPCRQSRVSFPIDTICSRLPGFLTKCRQLMTKLPMENDASEVKNRKNSATIVDQTDNNAPPWHQEYDVGVGFGPRRPVPFVQDVAEDGFLGVGGLPALHVKKGDRLGFILEQGAKTVFVLLKRK